MRQIRSILVLWLLVMIHIACDRVPSATSKRSLIVVSGDTAGWITPCGCAANQSGGLMRRGAYLQVLASDASITYLDAGGAAAGVSEYHKIKFEAILDGEVTMGLAAHNLGRGEIELGVEYLRQLRERRKIPFVSSNVRDAGGALVAEPIRIISHGGRRLAVVGVCSPRYAVGEVKIDDPRQAILSVIARHEGSYDALLVLAYLPEDELHQLAASLPEADAVIGGPTGQALPPRLLGPTLLAAATSKGKFVVELELPAESGAAWGGRVVEIVASLPEDARQLLNLRRYLARLDEADFPAGATGLVTIMHSDLPDGYRIAGSDSCASCHQVDQEIWHHSAHAHAWNTLKENNFHVDSYCQQCHTTGYGLPDGFASAKRSLQRVDVGCENCHGPSQAHVQNPEVRTPFTAIDQCIRCHDQENSPTFDFGAYWEKIRHKGMATTANR